MKHQDTKAPSTGEVNRQDARTPRAMKLSKIQPGWYWVKGDDYKQPVPARVMRTDFGEKLLVVWRGQTSRAFTKTTLALHGIQFLEPIINVPILASSRLGGESSTSEAGQ